jgi:hypothetical protein
VRFVSAKGSQQISYKRKALSALNSMATSKLSS